MSVAVFDASVALKWLVADHLLAAPALADAIEGVALLAKLMNLYPDDDLLAPAQRLAARLTHSVYDCLYLALAQRLSCPLVTADRRLAERAIHLGVSTTLIAPE